MHICPSADHYDGLFDITLVSKMTRRKAAVNVPRIFSGNFDGLPEVRQYRAAKVRIDMPGITAYVEGDGFSSPPSNVKSSPEPGITWFLDLKRPRRQWPWVKAQIAGPVRKEKT